MPDHSVSNSKPLSLSLPRTLELASVVPLVAVGISHAGRVNTHYELDLSRAKISTPVGLEKDPVSSFAGGLAQLSADIAALDTAYNVYTTTFLNPQVSRGRNGFSVSYQLKSTTKVPAGLPSDNDINNWNKQLAHLSRMSGELERDDLLDLNRFREIGIHAREGDATSQKLIAGLIYGSLAAGTLAYEEATAHFRAHLINFTNYTKEFEKLSSPVQISTRSFVKIGAAIIGGFIAQQISKHTLSVLDAGKESLGNEVSQARNLKYRDPDQNIKESLGLNLSEVSDLLADQTKQVEAALKTKIEDPIVLAAFKKVSESLTKSKADLELIQKDPESKAKLAYLSACYLATKQLESVGDVEASRSNLGLLFEGLGIAGAMAGIIIPAEVYTKRYSDKVTREAKRQALEKARINLDATRADLAKKSWEG